MNADTASVPDVSALPALKPNQPNQSRAAPRMANGRLCGGEMSGYPRRRAHHQGRRERAHPGADVHHDAAGEVESAHLPEEAARAPDPVRHRVVDDGGPQHGEEQERAEPHALREGPDDERRGDDREHHLVDHEELVRDGGRVVGVGRQPHPVQPGPAQPADDAPVVGPERQAVAERHPLQTDDRDEHQALHHDGQHVLAPHQPAVEEGQTRAS